MRHNRSFLHINIYLCLSPRDADFLWAQVQITAASSRSPTATRCYTAGGKGNRTSSASHHFALVYPFSRAFSGAGGQQEGGSAGGAWRWPGVPT